MISCLTGLPANGQQLKCLTVTDEWTREGLAIEVDGSIRSTKVIEVLSRLVSQPGAPLYMRSDNVLLDLHRFSGECFVVLLPLQLRSVAVTYSRAKTVNRSRLHQNGRSEIFKSLRERSSAGAGYRLMAQTFVSTTRALADSGR